MDLKVVVNNIENEEEVMFVSKLEVVVLHFRNSNEVYLINIIGNEKIIKENFQVRGMVVVVIKVQVVENFVEDD